MKMKQLVLALMMGLSLVGCSKERKAARAFEKFLEEETGQKYKIEKLYTLIDGSVVFKNKSTGEFVAYKVSKYNADTMATLADYLAVANQPGDVVHNLSERAVTTWHSEWIEGYWTYDEYPIYDSEGNITGYVRDDYYVSGYWHEYSVTTYYYDGDGFTFSENNSGTKDLDAIAASVEEADIAGLSNQIVNKFGLTEERAENLANLAVNYSKLETSRKLTAADKEVFAKKALGVSFADLESAYKKSAQGAGGEYQSLMNKAASVNGTSPEKARLLMDLYFSQAAN